MPDNGIKFFARGGNKLDDALEDAIESRLVELWPRPTGADVGRVIVQESLVEAYVAHLVNSLGKPVSLEGIKVVVDCANGAAFQAARRLRGPRAEVHRIHAEPDGININENCGSTHMDSLRSAVLEQRADIGIALDGDADRCLAVDQFGRIVDGDQILAILALALRDEGRLKNDTVVATVMSNRVDQRHAARWNNSPAGQSGGPLRPRGDEGRRLHFGRGAVRPRRDVGACHDRRRHTHRLHLMSRMASSGQSLAQLASVMTRLPQVLINARC